jgi:hypothetical protein
VFSCASTSFFGVVNKERLEGALKAIWSQSYTNELTSVELLNGAGEPVAAAPSLRSKCRSRNEFNGGVFWNGPTAILQNPIDFGNQHG